ncbi:hypothetical protein EYF80_056257 [Liparis tanakae]|uniref:Uncharacterized protein n=1 Tax=Liparis tanakae TaxID=230148 RepID=A0A4Z2EYC0_9TELE|nr:hypothetical protein EYF80_056257 [Liparis tanakae]
MSSTGHEETMRTFPMKRNKTESLGQVHVDIVDVQQVLVVKEEVPSEQQVWSFSLDQVHPEPPHIKEEQEHPELPHIKEEQEELWTTQEGEQLQRLEEAVKNDAEQEAQSSQTERHAAVENTGPRLIEARWAAHLAQL